MEEFIKYTFYDDNENLIAIIEENTPKKEIEELKKRYNEVKYEE